MNEPRALHADRESVARCSVLVPLLNEERHIAKTAGAIARQRFQGELEFIFVDGGSTDRTRQILEARARDDPRIRIFENPGRTVTSGLNVALRHAQGRWVARMDAHTEYRDDYVTLGVERLGSGGTRWVSGPPVPQGHGPVSRAVAVALRTELGRAGSRKWGEQGAHDQDEYELDAGVFGGVWERKTLLEYGGWDERWACNEDSEMAGRFLARGEHLVCLPAMAARYLPRNSLGALFRQYLLYGRYRARSARQHPHTMRRAHLLAPALVLDAALALAGPARPRRAARLGLGVYGYVVASGGLRALPSVANRSDALLAPIALVTMHVAWGIGFLWGAALYGPPTAAVARVAGLHRAAEALTPDADRVHAPSLS